MSHERRKTKLGKVISDKMDKTVVVSVEWRQPHRIYKKNVRKWSSFKAHDQGNMCRLGDTVRIVATRPLSKTKRWKIAEIIQKGDVAELQPKDISTEG
jgi:small subunit ribosomal protein S17